MRGRTPVVLLLLTLGVAPRVLAQVDALPSPLSFEAARQWSAAHNLDVDAARRGRAIRDANIRAAGQRQNPNVNAEVTRDSPHQTFTLNLPVELGSQRRRRIEVAQQESALAAVDVQASLRDVRRQVRERFFGLLAADERVRIADAVLAIATRIRDAASLRFDAGAVPRLDVMQADLGVARATADLDALRSQREASQATLDAVMNLPPRQALVLADTFVDHTTAPSVDEAVATALSSNIDLAALDASMAIEARRLALLRAQRTPVPVFSASGMFNSPGDFTAAPSASVSVGLPLFARNQGEIAASIATAAQLRGQREATRRMVENAVFAATARVEAASRQAATYRTRLIPAATELEALSEESYHAGRTSVLAVLDAQRSLRDLSRDGVQAALDLQMALAELEDLLGTPLP